jgi:hypothetical protein
MSADNDTHPMTHELKTWPEYFGAVLNGTKRFEYRDSSDRDFQVGDTLFLREWDPKEKNYSGRSVHARVSYILRVFATHVIMSLDGVQL